MGDEQCRQIDGRFKIGSDLTGSISQASNTLPKIDHPLNACIVYQDIQARKIRGRPREQVFSVFRAGYITRPGMYFWEVFPGLQ
jgi:hypothetical protein